MKKLAAILLILILVALCAPALAANANGQGDTVARNAELSAFLDGNGNIYVSGIDRPVNTTKAYSLVSIDPYRILFFAQANASAGVPQGRLIALTLGNSSESVITDDAYAACLDEENVYYISQSNRKQLVCYNLDNKTSATAFTSVEDLESIYATSIGVVVTQVSNSGSYITDSITGQFIPYAGDSAQQIERGDGFEVYLTDTAALIVRLDGALSPATVDSSVRAWAIVGRDVYYLCGNNGALSLKRYNVDTNVWNFILSLPADIEPQLTASENSLFVLSSNNVIYSVDVTGARLLTYATLPTPQSYALGGTRSVTGYRIEAVSGQLNLYGNVVDSSVAPTFTFVGSSAPAAQSASSVVLLSAYAIDAESTVWDLLQPAAPFSPLRRGSRGNAVSAIQQPLADLGYYNYYIDGIFGWRTERAVKLLQDALGLPVTGVADESLQRRILAGGLPAYDPYRALSYGSRGLRVTDMQHRLRDLGYLADDADGIFGDRTLAAVRLFQYEHGLYEDGVAGPETLRLLYSSNARPCSSYIDLRRGDSGYRVRELNRRLKELYYLEGSVGSTYTSATAEAVRRFQQEVGMRQTGEATVTVQQELFSRYAPEYSGYITLRRGDDNGRVLEMQRRLRDLGYYHNGLDGYFGKGTYQAVRDFQRRAGLKVTGVADPETLRRLYASDAPAYQEPSILGDPVIWFSDRYNVDENGVYEIPVTAGTVELNWTADGGVDHYTLSFLDEYGASFNGMDNYDTTSESLRFESADFAPQQDTVYTFCVYAHPTDTVNNGDTWANIKFRIVPVPSTLTSVTIYIQGDYTYQSAEDLYVIPQGGLNFYWVANGGKVGHYEYAIADAINGSVVASGEDETLTELNANDIELVEGTTYTLTVTAYPLNNDAEPVSNTLNFRVVAANALPSDAPDSEQPLSDTEATDTPEPEVTDTPEPEATDTPEPEATDTPEPEVTDTPEPEVTDTPEPEVTNTPAPEVDPSTGEQPGFDEADGQGGDGVIDGDTPETWSDTMGDAPNEVETMAGEPALLVGPNVGEIAMDVTTPDGSVASEPVVMVTEGTLDLSWSADGDVAGYNVCITDESGAAMVDENLSNTGAQLGTEYLVPNEVYTLTATAYFNSGETTSASLYFMLPGDTSDEGEVEETVEPSEVEEPYEEQPAVVEEPYVEEPYVEEPYVEEPYVEEPYVEEPYVEEPYVEEPYVEEPYVEEPYVEEPYVEEPYVEEPYVEEPYVEEPYVEEPYVEEPYVEEPYVEEPYVEEPYVEDSYESYDSGDGSISASSDPADIELMQQQLNSWGWLGDYSAGTLDGATVQAVIDFQYYCIDNGVSVSVTDPSDPVIGSDTLDLLFGSYVIPRP